MDQLNVLLKAGIELYTGRTVQDLKRFDDPVVPGAIGMRVTMNDGETIDFLLAADWRPEGRKPTAEDVDRALEETQFSTWPPEVGLPRFFT